MSILGKYGITVPSELMVPFRAMATVEGSLQILDPTFDFVAEAERYAKQRLSEAKRPSSLAHTAQDQLMSALPMLRRIPHRVDRLTGDLADGRFNMNIRMFADPRDRSFLRQLLDIGVVTFLAGVFGIMSTILLTSEAGPQLTQTITLFQIFGYMCLIVTGLLTLRALFEVLRRKPDVRR